MSDEQATQLIVLAGGKGSRLGADKSSIVIDGRPILEHLALRFAWKGPTVLVKARSHARLPGDACFGSVVVDRFPGEGPLGGIVSALMANTAEANLFLPIDTPNLTRHEVDALLSICTSASVACFDRSDTAGMRFVEPFPLVVRKSIAQSAIAAFDGGARSMRSLLSLHGSEVFPSPNEWDARIWANINTPQDLAAVHGTLGIKSVTG